MTKLHFVLSASEMPWKNDHCVEQKDNVEDIPELDFELPKLNNILVINLKKEQPYCQSSKRSGSKRQGLD